MLKPRLVKSLVTQNAALLREKHQLMDYLRVVEMSIRILTKDGKDTGIVDLKELHSLSLDMRKVIAANDVRNFEKMGTLRPPTKNDLGKLAEADQNIMHGFFQGSAEDMHEFFNKMITDLMNMKFQQQKDSEEQSNTFGFPISPNNFGGDLEGEWQDAPPPPEEENPFDPFGDFDVDKPE